MIDMVTFTIGPTAGGAGAATAEGLGPTIGGGSILAVYLDYLGGHPATTLVIIYDADDPPGEALIYKINNNSNTKFYPRRVIENNAGVVVLYNATYGVKIVPPPIIGRPRVTIAQSNPGLYMAVTLWYEKVYAERV